MINIWTSKSRRFRLANDDRISRIAASICGALAIDTDGEPLRSGYSDVFR